MTQNNAKGLFIDLTAGGDLSGGADAIDETVTVVGIQDRPVSSTSPTNHYLLTWTGSQWKPAAMQGLFFAIFPWAGNNVPIMPGVSTQTGSYTIADTDFYVLYNTSSGTVTLPATAGVGRVLMMDTSNYGISYTVQASTGTKLNGVTNGTVTVPTPAISTQTVTFICYDGTNWISFR